MNATPVASKGKDTTASKTVTVLNRVQIKTSNDVIYRVRNGEDREYQVTITGAGTTACVQCESNEPCPSTKGGRKCYHIKACVKREDARVEASYNGLTAEGVSADHASEKVQRYSKAAELGLSVVEYLQSLRVVSPLSAACPDSDGSLSAVCPQDAGFAFDARVMLSPEEHENAMIIPDDVVEAVIPIEENPFAPLCKLCRTNPAADSSGYCSPDCAEQAEMMLLDAEAALPELPQTEEEAEIDTMPLTVEEAQLFEAIGNEEIVLADEMKSEPKELTKAQVIMRIREGLYIMADCDWDYASKPNGIGFNGTDTAFGHDLASRHTLTEKQLKAAAKMLQKYNKTQLGELIPPMAVVEKVLAPVDYGQKGNLNRSNQGFNVLLHR